MCSSLTGSSTALTDVIMFSYEVPSGNRQSLYWCRVVSVILSSPLLICDIPLELHGRISVLPIVYTCLIAAMGGYEVGGVKSNFSSFKFTASHFLSVGLNLLFACSN